MTKPARPMATPPLKGSGLILEQRQTPLDCSAIPSGRAKCSEGQTVISFCMRAAFVSAGSSVFAAESNHITAIIAMAAVSIVAIVSACTVIIVQSCNRDVSIIDARARSTILRRWGRKASTPTEIERAATSAALPMVLAREDVGAAAEAVSELLQSTPPFRKDDNYS